MGLACCAPLLLAGSAQGYQIFSRWSTTASGSTGSQGSPIKLTWSFPPNGTTIPAPNAGSNSLITFLDAQFGAGPGGADLTSRPWYSYFSQSFDRWSQLSGATFTYQPTDDGKALQSSSGLTNVRGDIRIAGSNIDLAGGKLAQTSYPDNGDMQIDTSDGVYFSAGAPSHLAFRNTIMHELGHALGLAHVKSSTNALLMEANNSSLFDGPQIDDILGVQSQYGDFYEKSNNGAGNDTSAHATSLGAIAIGATKSIGTSAAIADTRLGHVVMPSDIDFVSIDRSSDTDYYSFSVSGATRLSVGLIPRGGSYMQGPDPGSETLFNASAQSDLSLAIYGTNGTTQLALVNNAPAGQEDIRSNFALPTAGQYYVRVTGSSSIAQLYELQLSVAAPFLTGDYNHNGIVDGADYTVWRDTLGARGLAIAADGDGNGIVDSADFGVWKSNYGISSPGGGALAGGEVPESPTAFLAIIGVLLWIPALAKRLPRPPQMPHAPN
jgi:serralysin